MDRNTVDLSRRGFLTGRRHVPSDSVSPPWTRAASVAAACTGCGACVPACPQHIIALDAAGRPALDFSANECSFCGACADACPEPVFDRAIAAFEHVAVIGPACFAGRGIVCQSCGDACPESAIRFRHRLGGPALPELASDRCSGCGACIASCPAQAVAVSPRIPEVAHG
ncbi:ferredoxin-type protein NapF [Bosea sp. BH3]|uniref:ferredoxin-type protein NapF n=1 Tax=Bosea sp. BH3 TaxID=2871701 RepID=UPI0021CAE588|nr:ferredoxin-type protein NapF [Bosea sp. BH3]MCU4179501.1 ferredoxin-type protein NapF [Bosea sp. BH3]